ncbi:hypothetical protein, partial [Mesorhizobium sp.]|uniref:hypothetical protein n=1 Tax=Mesorhizobium sp. TaxID=1871066 RepID=UPI0025D04E55
ATVDSWFSKLSGEIDNKELVELVKSAKQGVFFVMFQPGNEPVRTLLKMQKEKISMCAVWRHSSPAPAP